MKSLQFKNAQIFVFMDFKNRKERFKGGRTGDLAEWSNAAVLKTVGRESVPRVRIPESPPLTSYFSI